MITVLTPTYNRAHTLPRLFQTLCNQINQEFEWLIIDDGSNDDTEQLIASYLEKSSFKIIYIKKSNGGKHTALNLGFNKASFEWVFIVDSDDWLDSNTIDRLTLEIQDLSYKYNSICILRAYEDGCIIGDRFPDNIATYIDRINGSITGDKADVIRKSALDGFFFPEYTTENFMAESPLFLWLGSKGKTRFINFPGYICEYLAEGLSANSISNRHRCVNSTLFVYETQYIAHDSFKLRSRAAINWWRFRAFKRIGKKNNLIPIAYSPFGISLYVIDKIKAKVSIK